MRKAAQHVTKILFSLLGLAAIVGILAWLLGAFHETAQPGPPRPVLLRVPAGAPTVTVEEIDVPLTETAVGTIHPVHRVSVGAKLLARVKVMHVEKSGVPVEKGQLLVELDDSDLRARLAQVEAALLSAKAQRDQMLVERGRTRTLYEKKVEPKAALDAAETRVSTAEAEVTRSEQTVAFARAQMDYAKIHAPIDGIVIDKEVEAGDLVTPGQTLVTLYDPESMQLVARVRERLAMRLTPGDEVAVSIEALDLDCHGRIDQIVPEAQAASRVFEVRVTGPCPPGIYAGMFGRLHIPVGSRPEIRIPETAVRRVGQMETVYVVQEGGTLLRRFVQTGRSREQHVEVLAGLQPGEIILASARDAVQ
jgi:RND family efflux transporter MFP subunit